MKTLKILKITFAVAFLLQGFGTVVLIGAPLDAQAALKKEPINFQPQVGIPSAQEDIPAIFGTAPVSGGVYNKETGKTDSDLLAKYVQAIYQYALAIVGILAAVVLMAGGILWLTSAGNDTKIAQAKELITGSIIGAAILLGSYVILNTVNPELLKLKTISVTMLDEIILDGDDGMVDDLKNLPADIKYKWVCINVNVGESYDPDCMYTNPPTITLNPGICRKGSPNDPPSNCPYGHLFCCGLSESAAKKANDACQGKSDFTPCQVTLTSSYANKDGGGVCLQEKCVSDTENVCCDCGTYCVAGICPYFSCKNDLTLYECKTWCTLNNKYNLYSSYYGGSEKYTCAGGALDRCRPKE